MITSHQPDFRISRKKSTLIRRRVSCESDRNSSIKSGSSLLVPFQRSKKSSMQKSSIFKESCRMPDAIDFLCQKTLRLYDQNIEHFKLNENKLIRAIENQVRQKNLKNSEQLLQFLKKRDINKLREGLSPSDLINLQNQLQTLNDFLSQLYEKKKIQEIKILKQNYKDQETLLATQLDLQKFVTLHKETAFKQCNTNIDFMDEYHNICRKFGASQPDLKSHMNVRKSLNMCQKDITDYFQELRKCKTQGIAITRKKW